MGLIIIKFLLLSLLNPNPKTPRDFVWKNRILITQSTLSDSTWFHENLKQDLKDRKLLIFEFKGDLLMQTNSEVEIDEAKFLEKLQTKNQKPNYWVLIGLDGGLKNVGSQAPSPSDIFRIIDAMPMRQSEIRNGEKGKF